MSANPQQPQQPSGCPVDHGQMQLPRVRVTGGSSPSPSGAAPPTVAGPRPSDPLDYLRVANPQPLACDSSSSEPVRIAAAAPRATGGCPVDHSQYSKAGSAAAAHAAAVAHSGSGGIGVVGDVFPDATRGPTQRLPLSTTPVASTIPRGGAAPPGQAPLSPDATWIFPSPQRFYNAMAKKGWDPHEPDMAWVVGIHNTVNERTWAEVLKFESLHSSSCPNPKLVSFRGRPGDLSPKARIRGWFGAVAPFDRHDWVVDRCGKQVRYVIDFYSGPQAFVEDGPPGPGAAPNLVGAPPSIHLDVRPALTVGGLFDRVRMQIKNAFS